jgi:DoxX-like protein
MIAQNKAMTWTGRGITGLIGLMMIFSAAMKLANSPEVAKELVGRLGYPEAVTIILGVVELACVVLYLFPRTAILGAVLLTGYLGGAVATHVRIHDNFIPPVIGGVLVWLAMYLRDARVRALLPLCCPAASPEREGESRR